MVMKMLKYCQNLVEDEVLKQYDLKKCLLYGFVIDYMWLDFASISAMLRLSGFIIKA